MTSAKFGVNVINT